VVSTWGNPQNEVGWRIMRAPIASNGAGKLTIGTYAQVGTALANAAAWTDRKGSAGGFAYRVVAWNAAGETASNEVGMPTIPDAPGSPGSAVDLKTITLTWTTPSNGGAVLKSYLIELKGTGGNWSNAASVGPGLNTYSFTGLTPGTTYTYRISAVNGVGTSAAVEFAAAKIPSTPAAPTGLTGNAGVRSATASWTASADQPGAPVTGYQVAFGLSATGPWTTKTITSTAGTPPATTWTFTGLTKGQRLFFRVAAVNGVGTGGSATTSGFVTVQ
jgi:predicted phage tail protein